MDPVHEAASVGGGGGRWYGTTTRPLGGSWLVTAVQSYGQQTRVNSAERSPPPALSGVHRVPLFALAGCAHSEGAFYTATDGCSHATSGEGFSCGAQFG